MNARQQQAVRYVQQQGRITNGEYRALCPTVTGETLRQDCAELVQRGVLAKVGDKRGARYVLAQETDAMSEDELQAALLHAVETELTPDELAQLVESVKQSDALLAQAVNGADNAAIGAALLCGFASGWLARDAKDAN